MNSCYVRPLDRGPAPPAKPEGRSVRSWTSTWGAPSRSHLTVGFQVAGGLGALSAVGPALRGANASVCQLVWPGRGSAGFRVRPDAAARLAGQKCPASRLWRLEARDRRPTRSPSWLGEAAVRLCPHVEGGRQRAAWCPLVQGHCPRRAVPALVAVLTSRRPRLRTPSSRG